MNISIQPSKDPALVCRLNESVQEHHHQMFPERFKAHVYEALIHDYTKMLAQDDCTALIAYHKQQAIGYALCLEKHKTENNFSFASSNLWIDQMGVMPAFRSHGVGEQLIAAAEEFARSKGLDKIALSVWLANSQAVQFYENQGFNPYMQLMAKPID